jgi:four helix bundle protein
MSLSLPTFEKYEVGSQIRRSTKSIKSNIVDGYGRRKYKSEFIRFMVMSQASNDESIDHLETLFNTGSLKDEALYNKLREDLVQLGKEINKFIQALERRHNQW